MNRLPKNVDRAVANAARRQDIIDRARRAAPIENAAEIVRRPVDGMDERFGLSADFYRKDWL